ncbi:hypothetical protein Golob_017244 [Gossypium lobatum]|uniref:Uncharacterized protein n=1 Tax=Gossypium lobatum TaxID=34289 RepID=A0A7J8M6T3_9ROSI|nr:hypothetical protein [Gossypium lobatum]
MSPSCLLTSLSVIAAKLQSQSRMKLKLGFKTPFMVVFLISLLSNSRLSISSRSLLLSRNKHLRALLMALLLQTLIESFLLSSKMFKAGSTQIIQAWH